MNRRPIRHIYFRKGLITLRHVIKFILGRSRAFIRLKYKNGGGILSKHKKFSYRKLDRVVNLIELLLNCHPQGVGVLLGSVEPPHSDLIHAMMNAGRVPMPPDFKASTKSNETEAERIVYDLEYFNYSVKIAGGWSHIYSVTNEFKEVEPKVWCVIVDYIKFVDTSFSRYTSRLEYVAARHRLSCRTVTRYRNEFPSKLAQMILIPNIDE